MRVLIVGASLKNYVVQTHEALRSGLRRIFHTHLFGKGYPGYSSRLKSYQQIVFQAFAERLPEIVMTDYDIVAQQKTIRVPYSGIEKLPMAKAMILSDYWFITNSLGMDGFTAWVERTGISRILCLYPETVRIFSTTPVADRFVLLLATFDPEIFNDWGLPKKHDVGFLGAGVVQKGDFYPERFFIHQELLKHSGISYLWNYKHPGYQLYRSPHPYIGRGFSRLINSCKIFIATGGRLNLPLAKYVEVMASRSVLMGVKPDGADQLHLVDGVNYVSITAENVREKVDYYLARPELCDQIAAAGYEKAMRYHSCYARVLDFFRVVHSALNQDWSQPVSELDAKPASWLERLKNKL